jgi:sugar/nucleoside kinase (ribokinase family)
VRSGTVRAGVGDRPAIVGEPAREAAAVEELQEGNGHAAAGARRPALPAPGRVTARLSRRSARAGAVFASDPARQAQWSDHETFVSALPVPVQNTVGAGDAATAGLLYGLLADLDPMASLQLAARTAASRVSGSPIRRGVPA